MPATVVQQISQIAGPAALLSLGMAMKRYGFAGQLPLALTATALKLIAMPALVLVFATLLGLSDEWRRALVLVAAVPTGVNAG